MLYSTALTIPLALGILTKRTVAAPAPRGDSSISWGSCEGFGYNSTDTNFQCGQLDVPMDYFDGSAGTARLAVARYAATVSQKLGTIFFNPGGPGGSGVEVISELGPTFSVAFKGLFDVVSWDPRGVGNTFPGEVYCFDTAEENAAFWVDTVAQYINETISGNFDQQDLDELYSQIDSTKQKTEEFTQGCQDGASGPYLKYLGTSSTVRDLVSLGDAIVGPGKPIDYYGVSYGTVVGFNFINMFPQRVGHVVLDGVVDHDIWITYKFLESSLLDAEKSYSGLTDACSKAGKAGCKLIEITGDNATGDDVKTLLNNVLDIALELYRQGYKLPISPGLARSLLFSVLYLPTTWSTEVNTDVYTYVAIVLQLAQAYNIPIPGGKQYNVPSGTFNLTGFDTTPNLTSYTQEAIAGADDFADCGVTIRNVFDVIVDVTRDVTPTFGTTWSLGYNSYGWPVRSVEQLPPYTPAKLKYPVLVIGNMADPITPFASAQKTATLFGNDGFLVEQLGYGHTSLAQNSSCTIEIMFNYFSNSTLPEGGSTQCPVDDSDLFPPLNGTTAATKRSSFMRRRF